MKQQFSNSAIQQFSNSAIRRGRKFALIALTVTLSGHLFAADFTKENNTSNLSTDASWKETGRPNGASDVAIFDSTITSNLAVKVGGITVQKIVIKNVGGDITLYGDAITLNGGIDMSEATGNLKISSVITLANTPQTFVLGNGKTLELTFYQGNGTADSGIAGGTSATNHDKLTITGNGNFIYGARNGGYPLTLTNDNDFTGTFAVLGAAVNLNGANGKLSGVTEVTLAKGGLLYGNDSTAVDNRINTSAKLVMGHAGDGGGVLNMVAGNQTFASIDLANGYNRIQNAAVGKQVTISGDYIISGHAVLRVDNEKGLVFSTPATLGNLIGSGADAILYRSFIGENDLATVNASGEVVKAAYATNIFASGTNTFVTGAVNSGAGGAVTQAIKLNNDGNLAIADTLTVESGMIIAANGSGQINSGTLLAGTGKNLIFITENSRNPNVSSVIADNGGSTGLEKYGAGQLYLGGNNTFTGEIWWGGSGDIILNHKNALGSGSATIHWLGAAGFQLNNAAADGINITRNIDLDRTEGTFKFDTKQYSGTISGNFSSFGNNYLFFQKVGTGTLTLSGNGTPLNRLIVTGGGDLVISGTWDQSLTPGFEVRTDGAGDVGKVNTLTVSGNGVFKRNGGALGANSAGATFNINLRDNALWEEYANDINLNGWAGGIVTLDLSGNSIFRVFDNKALRFGTAADQTTTVNVSGNAYVNANNIRLNYNAGAINSVSTLNIFGSGSVKSDGDFTTANSSYNTSAINVSGNGSFSAGNSSLNTGGTNNTITVSVTDSGKFQVNDFTINNGSNSKATLTVSDSAYFKAANFYINGSSGSSTASVTFSGSATGTASGQLRLNTDANYGVASLTLQDHAQFIDSSDFYIAHNSAFSTSTLTVKDNALLQVNNLYGNNGSGTNATIYVNLQDSGTIRAGANGQNNIQFARIDNTVTVINQTGGWLEGGLQLQNGTLANAKVDYHLDGGVVRNYNNLVVGAGATLLLNGGTISQKNTASLQKNSDASLGTVLVQAGGANFDVDSGLTFNVRLALQHDGAGADGGLVKTGAGTLLFTGEKGSSTYTGATVIKNGKLQVDAGALATSELKFADLGGSFQYSNAALTLSGISTEGSAAGSITNVTALTLNGSGTYRYAGSIGNSGATTLAKTGAGFQELSGAYNAEGAITVSGGVLLINTDISKAASVTVSGGELKYNSAAAYANTLTFTSGVISGTGNLSTTALTVGANRVISPGNSAGELKTGAQTWETGGAYQWEIADLTGVAGTGWDLLTVNGTLNLSGLSASGFTITLDALSGYTAIGGDYTGDNALQIVSASGITGTFNENLFTLNNSVADFENLQLIQKADGLYLSFSVIPEPSTWLLLGTGVALLTFLRRRR